MKRNPLEIRIVIIPRENDLISVLAVEDNLPAILDLDSRTFTEPDLRAGSDRQRHATRHIQIVEDDVFAAVPRCIRGKAATFAVQFRRPGAGLKTDIIAHRFIGLDGQRPIVRTSQERGGYK